MAKSIAFRTFIDESTGRKYQFNNNTFKKNLHNRTNKEKQIFQITLLRQIEEKYNMPIDRVQKWLRGVNGPADMQDIKDLANFFEIDYHELLIEIAPTNKDESMINNEEKSIIKQIFGECVSILYKVQEMTNSPKLPTPEKSNMKRRGYLSLTHLSAKYIF